jgi:integrase
VDKKRELKKTEKLAAQKTFYDISALYLEDCEARFQLNTWRQKAFVYRSFLAFLGSNPPIEGITKQHITAYLQARRERDGNKAANRDLRDLKALYNWAINHDYLVNNPCKGIERYPEDSAPPYVPPAEDIDKVILAAQPDEMDLILVLYHTLGRIGEVLRMTWEDVNLEQRWVRLWTRKRKGGELQRDNLPMGDVLYEILARRWKNRDKESQYVFPRFRDLRNKTYRLMRRLCRRAGVKEFGFHAIRHHVASVLQDSGKATVKEIQLLLRHRRQSTTDKYLHLIERHLRDAVNILDERTRGGKVAAQMRQEKLAGIVPMGHGEKNNLLRSSVTLSDYQESMIPEESL